MEFHVGPHTYKVVVSDRSIYDAEGNEMEGCAIESRRLLIVSRIVEPERRYEVALHEFFHAWAFHVPPAADEEQQADLAALVSQQFQADLDAQGGTDALLELEPQAVPQIGNPVIKGAAAIREVFGSTDRLPCAACDASVMCGSILSGTPTLHEPTGKMRVQRWFRCDACACVQVWWEQCDPDGSPLGEIIPHPRPRVLRGPDASRWMAEHAEVAGAI